MKKIFLTIILLVVSQIIAFAQAGFIKVTDPTNPVTTFTTPGFYKGAAWVDIDNDHDVDLFAAPNLLFRNNGNGAFFQLINPFNFTPIQNPGGASWADLNNDGLIDCIIAQDPSGVYINAGNGIFTNISAQIDSFNTFPAWGCAIGDWNKDAFPDFVFAHAGSFHNTGPFPSKLYLNSNATLHPQYITGYLLTDSVRPYTVPYWSDYDLDGDMDLFVASGPGGSAGPDFCYKNLKMETGADTLQEMTTELFVNQLQDGQCYNFIDFDNDGDLDLCLTNYAGAPSRFYINTAGTYVLQPMPFTAVASNLTNDWGDFDNDGDLDVLITNDVQVGKYYANNGNGTFSAAITLGSSGAAGVTNGDYDNDGDLDLFIHGIGNARALFMNATAATGNNWINMTCNGTVSNNSAIGTIIRLKATISGNSFWQIREISAQNSFQSQNDLRVHFGLGNATIIDSIIIQYPLTPAVVLTNITVNQFYCHVEGTPGLCLLSGIHENNDVNTGFTLRPNPADSFISIIVNNQARTVNGWNIYDATGKVKLIGKKEFGMDFKIDISSLSSGEYFISIFCDPEIYSLRFMKF